MDTACERSRSAAIQRPDAHTMGTACERQPLGRDPAGAVPSPRTHRPPWRRDVAAIRQVLVPAARRLHVSRSRALWPRCRQSVPGTQCSRGDSAGNAPVAPCRSDGQSLHSCGARRQRVAGRAPARQRTLPKGPEIIPPHGIAKPDFEPLRSRLWLLTHTHGERSAGERLGCRKTCSEPIVAERLTQLRFLNPTNQVSIKPLSTRFPLFCAC